jgi:hypothetical protein
MPAVTPNRANGVDHPLGGQIVPFGDLGFTGPTAVKRPAFLQQFWAGRPVNCAINTAAAQQGRIGRIHDRVHVLLRDIALNNLNAIFRHESKIGRYPSYTSQI